MDSPGVAHDPPQKVPLNNAMKALLFSAGLAYIGATVALGGAMLGDNVTPLGAYLVMRTILQTRYSRLNLQRMRGLTRPALSEAIKRLFPQEDWTRLDNETMNQSYEEWRQKIQEHPIFVRHPFQWGEVIRESFAPYPQLMNVGALVPAYGLQPVELGATLQSLDEQSYRFQYVVVIVNEPGNVQLQTAAEEMCILRNLSAGYEKFIFINRDRAGKRGAMAAGFRKLKELGVDLIINVDADTVADSDAVANTVRVFLEDAEVHLLTSNVRIKNIDRKKLWSNMLKQWTYYRYDYANNVDRGSESWFKNVTCGSGPWLAIRAETLTDEVIDKFLSHSFAGAPVRPGDDRYLTRLLNMMGKGTVYSPDVVVWTDCPTTWRRFRSQQSRWAQSAQIGFFQQVTPLGSPSAEIWQLTPWSISNTFYLGLFPYLITGVFLKLGYRFITTWSESGFNAAIVSILPYVVAFVLSNLWKGLYASLTNKDWRGMVNAFYFLVVIFVINPIRVVRTFNLRDTGWGGRIEAKTPASS